MTKRAVERVGASRLYRGRVVDLRLERLRLPEGREVELEIVRHVGAAAVVPVTAEGQVVLLRQWRYATGGWLLEIPAGKLDHKGEDPEACARSELEEETGWVAGNLTPLGWIWTTPGFADEKIWLYLATELERGVQNLEDDELLTVEELPFAEAVRRARTGEITDSKSICAILRAEDHIETD